MKQLKIADLQNNNDETALHLAVRVNNPIVVDLLLPVGANPNIVDNQGNTPLHLVIQENLNLDDFKNLIEQTDINKENYDGYTPLHLAILKNNYKSVVSLTQANANVNIEHASNGNTVLHMAIEEKNPEIVKFLLEKTNARIDAENYSKTTPVHMAKLLASEGPDSKHILDIIETYIKEKGFESLVIKNEVEEETNSDVEIIQIKTEPNSPNQMEIDDNSVNYLKEVEFTEECIYALSEVLDNTDVLIKLAKELDFDSVTTSMSKICTKMLLNYANVTGIYVYRVRELLKSYGMDEAVHLIDDCYI